MAQGASEYVRGFSFMPENKVDVIDLQYIEGGELSRAWKMSRRERLKNIEAKIWDEFISERDMVDSVSSDDPYQFIDKLPEDCVREVLDTELMIMKKELEDEPVVEPSKEEFKDPQEPQETMVTFSEALEDEQCDLITIIDEEDEASGSEGGEREECNDSMESPCTVREKSSPELSPKNNQRQREEISPENMRSMIETSINTVKVKELQSKVNLELLSLSSTLEVQNLSQVDPNSLSKLRKQCTEFCARYCRIYLYPITRQIHDITRHNNAATPFARHTHTRSQMIRALSLQQNMLQSLQTFHKWITQKTPLRECVFALQNVIQQVRDADSVCPAEVHNGELLQTCESLNEALARYLVKLNNSFGDDNATNASVARSGKTSRSMKKRAFATWNKQGLKSRPEADAKLSMYSLDRSQRHSKSSIGRLSGGTSKARMAESGAPAKVEDAAPSPAAPGKKTLRSRRPLMRAPGGGPRRAPPDHDSHISTLVETVDIVSSRQASTMNSPAHPFPAASPRCSPAATPRRSPAASPRRSPRRSPAASPHRSPRHLARSSCSSRSPRSVRGIRKSKETSPCRKLSPKQQKELKLVLKAQNSEELLPSVIKVQCAKKDSPVVNTPVEVTPRTGEKSDECKKDPKDVNSSSDVSVLLRRLCAGQSSSKLRSPKERASGSKNTQLLCINGGSPRAPSFGTPLLLRILEETIQKQAPKPQFCTKVPTKDIDRFRLSFDRTGAAADALFQYRTKFVQHMLLSPMYANSAVGKPWEMIGKISENIIDEILLSCAKEMQLEDVVEELYKSETHA